MYGNNDWHSGNRAIRACNCIEITEAVKVDEKKKKIEKQGRDRLKI